VQVDVRKLADDLVQKICRAQPVDLDTEIELVDDIVRGLGKASDVEL